MSPRQRLAIGLAIGVLAPTSLWLLSLGSAWVSVNLATLVALVFILAPRWLDPKPPERSATALSSPRSIALGLGLVAIVLPFFIFFNHFWLTRAEGWRAEPSLGVWFQLPDRAQGQARGRDGQLAISRFDSRVNIRWKPEGSGELRLRTDATVTPLYPGSAQLLEAADSGDGEWRWRIGRGDSLSVSVTLRSGSFLHFEAHDSNGALDADRIVLGESDLPPDPAWRQGDGWRLPLNLLWMLPLLLGHLIVVAIPEEIFFRGFLQRRFEEAGSTKRLLHLRGWQVTTANLWTSVAFAIVHMLIGLNPLRLSVFFPSLAFGAIRDRSGGLIASIIFHAGSNLMVAYVAPHYLPI